MSNQKGNISRCRPQKHQNHTQWKSNHPHKTTFSAKPEKGTICQKCLQIIQWKIKYNKYKPLTKAKKCTKCEQNTIKHAYHTVCNDCSHMKNLCVKCGKEDNENEVTRPDELQT